MVTKTNTTVADLESKIGSLETEVASLRKRLETTIHRAVNPNSIKALENLPPWTEPRNVAVPLKDIEYRDSGVLIPLNGERVSIAAELLPFKTSTVINKVKYVFESNLTASIYKISRLRWESGRKQLEIENTYALGEEIKVGKADLEIFGKIESFYNKLRRKYDPFKASSFLEKAAGDSKPVKLTDVKKAPKSIWKDPKYDKGCVRFLIAYTNTCFITGRDFWFRKGDRLAWEEPRRSKATYIFKWPVEPLQVFICRVWISALKDIRGDPKSGYIGRVIHDRKNRLNWEANVRKYI